MRALTTLLVLLTLTSPAAAQARKGPKKKPPAAAPKPTHKGPKPTPSPKPSPASPDINELPPSESEPASKPAESSPSPPSPPVAEPNHETPNTNTARASVSTSTLEPLLLPKGLQNALVVGELGAGFLGRSFSYKDGLSNNLSPYDVSAAPAFGLRIELYPVAGSASFAKNLGLVAHYSQSLSVTSKYSVTGDEVKGAAHDVGLGVRVRLPFGDAGGGAYGQLGWMNTSFTFEEPLPLALAFNSPGGTYSSFYLRGGARIPVVPSVSVLGDLALGVTNPGGSLGARFPRASGGVMDLELGVAIPLMKHFEVRALGGYRRFFLKMNPEVGDFWVAGGALDAFWTGRAAFVVWF